MGTKNKWEKQNGNGTCAKGWGEKRVDGESKKVILEKDGKKRRKSAGAGSDN